MSGEPRKKYGVSMPKAVAEEARRRAGAGGFSAYVTAAVMHRLALDGAAEPQPGPGLTTEPRADDSGQLADSLGPGVPVGQFRGDGEDGGPVADLGGARS